MSSLTEIDELIGDFFAVFDNRGQRVPDMSSLNDMFLPGATITKVEGSDAETMSVADFITPRESILTDGSLVDFHEWEVSSKTHLNDATATRLCEYEKAGKLFGEEYSGSGSKSIQLVRTHDGWKISSVLWEDS